MRQKLIDLTMKLMGFNSISTNSNSDIIYFLEELFKKENFTTELLTYRDSSGIDKFNLVASRGSKSSGIAFLIHSDTVPPIEDSQMTPVIKNDKIYGRGACDMKGPAAAAILASFENKNMPITFIITSDEEVGCIGAEYSVKNSTLIKKYTPLVAIATEPTELKPIHAHKGLCNITVVSRGVAAHSSTDIGVSSNFKMVPFLNYIHELKEIFECDESYMNRYYTPSTNTLNLTVTDFNCPPNITSEKTKCGICFRVMPDARHEEIINNIRLKAEELRLEFKYQLLEPVNTNPETPFVKIAEKVCGKKAGAVAYLTDASLFANILDPIILGPGSIKKAHTADEFIDINELYKGYTIYSDIIKLFYQSLPL